MPSKKIHGISMGTVLMLLLTAVVLVGTAFVFFSLSGASAEGMVSITLGAEDQSSGDTWQMTDAGLRISGPGEYLISGTLENGQIWVDSPAKGKVILYLNGVQITNPTGPAILIGKCSPRAVISLVDGTENTLANGSDLTLDEDEEPDGVIFSHSDLTFEGNGALRITAGAMNGIVSKDDLKIEGGQITVTAPKHGIKGKDFVEISGGTLTIQAGKDGIKSTNKKDITRGYVEISGGEINITCGSDPISVVTNCDITGGTIHVTMNK